MTLIRKSHLIVEWIFKTDDAQSLVPMEVRWSAQHSIDCLANKKLVLPSVCGFSLLGQLAVDGVIECLRLQRVARLSSPVVKPVAQKCAHYCGPEDGITTEIELYTSKNSEYAALQLRSEVQSGYEQLFLESLLKFVKDLEAQLAGVILVGGIPSYRCPDLNKLDESPVFEVGTDLNLTAADLAGTGLLQLVYPPENWKIYAGFTGSSRPTPFLLKEMVTCILPNVEVPPVLSWET